MAENSIEMTAEEVAAIAELGIATSPSSSSSTRSNGHPSKSVGKRISKLIKPMSKNLHFGGTKPSKRETNSRLLVGGRTSSEADNSSFNGESIGQMSVAQTIASVDTVKISNRQIPDPVDEEDERGNSHKGRKATWKKLKKFMGIPPTHRKGDGNICGQPLFPTNPARAGLVAPNGPSPTRRTHSKSVDFKENPMSVLDNASRRRIASVDFLKSSSKATPRPGTIVDQQAVLDDAIRGRLDGIDMLYLGPANLISLERQKRGESSTPFEPAPSWSFAGRSTQYSVEDMVTDMIWQSAGHETPEIVLEGFFRDDRWTVKLDLPINRRKLRSPGKDQCANGKDEEGRHTPETLPHLQLTDEEEHSHSTTEDDIPRHKLWGSMWGTENKPPPKPSHMTSVEDVDESDNILEMAASCSVPVDVDEDTFMIGNPQHLHAVHELASIPLQHSKFDEALAIFEKILVQENEAKHLEGVTLHNRAVILMWQAKYKEALDTIGQAIKSRLQYLPENHPDIAVSLTRQGHAYFALNRLDLAIASFEAALDIFTDANVVRAKVLGNLGVARYQKGDDNGALKCFANALEIQRLWIQGRVRRESAVFGAAVLLGNMGKIHVKRGEYDLAVAVYEEALLLHTSIFRNNNEIVIGTRVSLALAWAFNAQPKKSAQILSGVLRSQLTHLSPETPEVIEITGTIGNLHFGLGNYEDALKNFAPVLKWQKTNLKSDHPSIKKTKEIMKQIKNSIQAVWV